MNYPLSKKYDTPIIMEKIMGPNPLKLCEELMADSRIEKDAVVCDLGSGEGVSSVFLAKEYDYKVYACDLWSEPEDHIAFFKEMGVPEDRLIPIKADANALPFPTGFFDAVVCIDSYNFFGREAGFLDKKLLPHVKSGGYLYLAISGMVKDCHDALPEELLLSWTPEQMDYMHDIEYWSKLMNESDDCDIIEISQMQSMQEVWDDWLRQENEYAVSDRKSMQAGAGKYLNFIKVVLRKK